MAWIRYESAFVKHPKVHAIPTGLRADALALHLAACSYSADLLTDGFVPSDVLPDIARIVGVKSVNDIAKTLLKVGLFEPRKRGFQLHDYNDYNPKASDVKEARARDAERKRTARASQKQEVSGSPSEQTSRGTSRRTSEDLSDRTSKGTPRARSRAIADGRARPVPLSLEGRESLEGPPPPTQSDGGSALNGAAASPDLTPWPGAEAFVRDSGWRLQPPMLGHRLVQDFGVNDPDALEALVTLGTELQHSEEP